MLDNLDTIIYPAVLSDGEILVHPQIGDAAMHVWTAFERLNQAKTLGEQANAFTDLSNAVADLGTWLPGWNSNIGEVSLVDPATAALIKEAINDCELRS